jgi:membrane-bound serine protease (ClpP class)
LEAETFSGVSSGQGKRQKMIDFLFDPNVAYVLLVVGFVLAILALASPGTGFIELGALFLLFLAGFSMFRLPINLWALIVLILGVVPFMLALRRVRHWSFLLVSLTALIVGTIFLFRTDSGAPAIDPTLAVIVSVSALGVLWIIGRRGLEAVLQAPSFDLDRLVDQTGMARNDILEEGTVYVQGEEWTARSEHQIKAGSRIRVTGREGLVLLVEELTNDIQGEDTSAKS